MEQLKRHNVLYLFLLPIFYTLHYYNELFGFITAGEILKCLLILYSLILVLYFLIRKYTGSGTRAAFIVFASSVFLLYFGPYHDLLKSILGSSVFSSYKVAVPVTIILIILITRSIIKRPATLNKLGKYLVLLLIFLNLFEIVILGINSVNIIRDKNLIYPSTEISGNYIPLNTPDTSKPDIYFLIFDEYTNNSVLKKLWNYDNSSITSWLSEKGFYVLSNSKSNYNFSPYSISSELNMDYLSKKAPITPVTSKAMLKGVNSMTKNQTIDILRKENYSVRYFGPFNNSIEQTIPASVFNNFGKKLLYDHTFPARIEQDVLWNFSRRDPVADTSAESGYGRLKEKARNIKKTIELIKSTANRTDDQKPQFVFGHLLITHEPHVFDSSGYLLSVDRILSRDLFQTYIQQVNYSNKVIMDLVQYIQQHNKRNTIIIIKGDHGYREVPEGMDHFSNFNVIYFPDKDYRQLYDSMSSVNTFRIVFNHYFNQHFPLLKDSTTLVDSK